MITVKILSGISIITIVIMTISGFLLRILGQIVPDLDPSSVNTVLGWALFVVVSALVAVVTVFWKYFRQTQKQQVDSQNKKLEEILDMSRTLRSRINILKDAFLKNGIHVSFEEEDDK